MSHQLAHFCIFIFLFLVNFNAAATLTLKEVRTASKDVLIAYFTSDTLDLMEAHINHIEQWKINGKPVTHIYRFVTQADPCDHHIYLQTDTFKEGKKYHLETPYGSYKFRFSERDIFCESIKTNQAGYSGLSKTRYANFAVWLGTGGSRQIQGKLPRYEVILQHNGKKISEGEFEIMGSDSSSGDFVYRIDLSEVPEGGPYKIVVKGYGCSYPFGIGGEFSKRLAYLIFRAQYLQRCGCPIHKPALRKKPCHTRVYDVDGPIGEANIEVKGDEPFFKCFGGYHDAGDADRRAYHMANPIVNLLIYEAFPESFFDGQYDIPGQFDEEYNILDYTNGIPDILDEAEWGTLVWEYLQNEDGSVHFGTETKGYPHPFAAPMDNDHKKYGTVHIDPRATCTAAGLFMHLARVIKAYKPDRAAELAKRAEKAMAFGADDMAEPEKLYYFIQRYLFTGDDKDHEQIRKSYTSTAALKDNLFITNGYSLNDDRFDNPAYFFSYIIEKNVPTDSVIVHYFKSAIREAADSNMAELKRHAYPVANHSSPSNGWGHNVRQPMYACCPMLQWRLTREQHYLDAASEMMDWKLGLNPVGISYVTGLGFHQVHNPHDREFAYSMKKGLGPKPGITVFGPGILTRWRKSPVIPPAIELAKERQFVDDIRAIAFTEFTIFETMSHDALYTVLTNGGKWNGEDPFAKQKN